MYQGCVDTRNMDYLSHGDWAKHFQSSIHSFNEGMKTAKYDHITIITYQISFLPSLNYLLCQRRMCVLTGLEFFSYSNCLYLGTGALHHWEDWLEHTERLIMYSYMYQNIESYTVNAQHPAILLWYVCVCIHDQLKWYYIGDWSCSTAEEWMLDTSYWSYSR